MTRTFKQRELVWAVVRFDSFQSGPESAFTIKEIVRTQELAEAEVARLNRLNADKGCRYWAIQTRLFPPGTAAGPSDAN